MDYNNSTLDPEVTEFCYAQRSKASHCHSHHAQAVPFHRMQTIPPLANLLSSSDGCHRHPPLPATNSSSIQHTVVTNANVEATTMYNHSHNTNAHHHHHRHPQEQQYLLPHSGRQHYRSSLSPGQIVSSTTCGSASSSLSSSSGFCSASTSQTAVTSSLHYHQKPSNNLRAIDLIKLLREKIALLPGGRSRDGGPILCFPPNSRAGDIPFNELRLLVWYLTCLPEERIRKLGFTVIVDMRNGTTWQHVKPILKVVDCCLEKTISRAYIIKPDKIFEKHKALMAVGKFTFEIRVVSIESLFREVDPSQLTADLEGSLPYNHEEWIKIRCSVEEFFLLAHDMSDQFCQLYKSLQCKYMPDTVEEARRILEEHRSIRLKICQAPVSTLEAEAERLMVWLRYGISSTTSGGSGSATTSCGGGGPCAVTTMSGNCAPTSAAESGVTGGGGGASFLATSWVSMNPDFQQLRPQVQQTIVKLYQFRTVLQQKWESGRSQLEQIYQLRIFDEDTSRMANWLGHQRHMFLTEYWDIGENASRAADLHAEHRQFLTRCSTILEQITRLSGVASMLADNGHFASQQILKKASQLEHDWKSFTAALEDRSRVLYLSATFNARAQSFIANCVHRETSMRKVTGNTLSELNQALDTLQTLWREAQSAHEEVCADGRALAEHLSAPVPTGSHTSLTAAVNYSQGRKHCTDLLHEIWSWFKQLERVFTERNSRLTSQLALLMFKEDVKQVLAWLSNHGEPFLQRQTAVGKSIQRAEQLYNSHMQFEQVAANTLTNAAKLISAADELAPQVDDPDEILQKANELQSRISAFTRAVETRRETLDVGCGFYSHTREVLAFLHAAREDYAPPAQAISTSSQHILPVTIEATEEELTEFHHARQTLEANVDRAISEGEALVGRLQEADEVAHLGAVLAQISTERSVVSTLLTERQVRLDLCLQLRLFEADVHSALDGLLKATAVACSTRQQPSETYNGSSVGLNSITENVNQAIVWLVDTKQAPEATVLETVSNACVKALSTAEEVLNKGGELARAFSSVGVNFAAGGSGSSDSGVGESVETAVERVHRLIGELNDSITAVDELNERLIGELDWRRLQIQSSQVLQWIDQFEEILRGASTIPASLSHAEMLQREHEQFQPVLNHAHPQAVQCAARASHLLQQLQQSGAGVDHPQRKDYQAVAEAVANRWQKLVFMAEERHKLLIAATSCYRTFDQVTSVLRSLEKEYHREEDWCQSEKSIMTDTATYLSELSLKHAEQKEAFLKACMLARRTSDLFTRYLQRQPPSTRGRAQVEEKIRQAISELMSKEQAVLEAWAVRRRRLDDCTCFINIKRQVEDLLIRVQKSSLPSPSKGGGCLSTSTQQLLNSSLLQEVNRACDSLDSMLSACLPLSPGHVSQLKALLVRLHAVVPSSLNHQQQQQQQQPQQQQHKLSVGTSSSSSGLGSTASSSRPSSELSSAAATVGWQVTPRSHQQPTDGDRTSLSSTSTAGSGGGSVTSPTVGLTSEQRRMQRRRDNLLRELIQSERSYIQSIQHCMESYYQCLSNPPLVLDSQYPPSLRGKLNTIFGNMPEILEFHLNTFEPELGKYTESGDFLPEDVGHCFAIHSERIAELYVEYCVNNTEATQLIIEHGQGYFQTIQRHMQLMEPLQSFLIKPVQRVTKYQLLLRELRDCCEPASVAELSEGLEAMLNVPKRANDALHLSMLQNLPDDLPITSFGQVILQDQFTVWEPKQLIKKSRERRVFLFDNCLLITKEVQSGADHKARYQYKSRLLLSECNITEHIEGDQCKFALWTGRVPPLQEYRLVLKAGTLDLKQTWVRALREMQREHMFSTPSLFSAQSSQQQPSLDKSASLGATATTTVDTHYLLDDYQACGDDELTVSAHQAVQVLHRCDHPRRSEVPQPNAYNPYASGQWALVRLIVLPTGLKTSPAPEGFIPVRLLGAPVSSRRGQPATSVLGNRFLSSSSGMRRNVTSLTASTGKRTSKLEPGRSSQIVNHVYQVNRNAITSTTDRTGARLPPNAANHQQQRQTEAKVNSSANGGTLIDNVSEESVDVELPPPMGELAALPTAVPPTSSVDVPADQDGNNCAGEEELVGDDHNNTLLSSEKSDCHSSPTVTSCEFRPVALPEVTVMANCPTSPVPSISGLPNGANLGELRLHGSLQVAARLVASPSFGNKGSADQQQTQEPAGHPDEMEELLRSILEEGVQLHFVTRHLFLYDRALVVTDAAVQLIDGGGSSNSSKGEGSVIQCHFRQAIPIGQLSILEDVSLSDAKPTGDQLLWFCLLERARISLLDPSCGSLSPQSHLCYVVAPQCPDTRARWVTEVSTMVRDTRRLSHGGALLLSNPQATADDESGPLQGSSPADCHFLPSSALLNAKTHIAGSFYPPPGVLFDAGLLDLHKMSRLALDPSNTAV